MRKYYAIVVDYAGCNYNSHEILAVYLSENKAKQEFKKAVEEHFKPLYYDKNTDMIYENSDTCYDIGINANLHKDEFYDKNHLCVKIQEVSGNWRYGLKFFTD